MLNQQVISKQRAFVVYEMTTFLQRTTLKKDVENSLFSNGFQGIYESLANAYKSTHPLRRARTLFIEFEYQADSAKNISSANTQIIAGHIAGVEIQWGKIDPKVFEADHLQQLNCQFDNYQHLVLTNDPLEDLSHLPQQLLFFLFVDFRFFDWENWLAFDIREPGCIGDLFTTLADIESESPSQELSLEYFKKCHAQVAKHSLRTTSRTKPGELRESYNSFPLNATAVTKQGIKDLLLRIQADNTEKGFMLGEVPEFHINDIFFEKIKSYLTMLGLPKAFPKDLRKENDYKTFLAIKEKAIVETYQEVSAKNSTISLEDITKLIEKNWQDFQVENQIKNHIAENGKDSLFIFRYTIEKYIVGLSTNEYAFNLNYARQNALARAGGNDKKTINIATFSPEQIDKLANDIYQTIIQCKKTISLLTPDAELAKEWAKKGFNNYYQKIKTLKAVDEKLLTIIDLIQELERLHLFAGCNVRLCYLMLNKLQRENQIKHSVLFNPNRMDGFDRESFLKEDILGIYRLEYIIANSGELLAKNEKIQTFWLENIVPHLDYTPDYEKYCKPLTDLLLAYKIKRSQKTVVEKVENKEDAYQKAREKRQLGNVVNKEESTDPEVESTQFKCG